MSSGRYFLQSWVHQSTFSLMHSKHFNLSDEEKLGHSYWAWFKLWKGRQVSHIGSLEDEKLSQLGSGTLCIETMWFFNIETELEVKSHSLQLNISLTLWWIHFLWKARPPGPLRDLKSHISHLYSSSSLITLSCASYITFAISFDWSSQLYT